jgi:diguanylate cyclase (GGDEF)-like protein
MHTPCQQRRWNCAPASAGNLVRAAALWLGLGVLLTGAHEAAAQQFTTRRYQQPEDIGNLAVTCLLQDRAGFIWMCTESGLYRHDGVGFQRFGTNAGIDSITIRSALEDSGGALWIGTAHDLYRREESGFRAIRPDGHGFAFAAESQFAPLASGSLLVIDAGQLLELKAASADGPWHSSPYFTQEQIGATRALEHLSSVYVDRQSRIWLGCGTMICKLENGRMDLFDPGAGVPDDVWRSWLLDREGRLWARGLAHVAVLDAQAARFETRDPPRSRMTGEGLSLPLAEDPQGRILTTSKLGLARWQPDGWQDFTKSNGIPEGEISALLVSRDGQVWMGFRGHGLVRWLAYGQFEAWTMAQGLGDFRIQSMLRDTDHSMLLATRAGCYRLESGATMALACRFGNLPAGDIRLMARGGTTLWIAMARGGLFRVDAEDQRATWVADVPSMRKLLVDSNNRLWICTDTGVNMLAPGATPIESMTLPTSSGAVSDATEDADGAIWFATEGGLLRWAGGRWLAFNIPGEQARAGFASIAADRDGWLWAGGAPLGMLHVHISSDRIDNSQWVPDPLVQHSAISFTGIDRRGWIWAGTDAGVLLFDRQTWRRFTAEDGLISNYTVENSFFADSDGSVWIGTRGGSTHIQDPEALIPSAPIDLRITRTLLGGHALGTDSPRLSWEPGMALTVHLAQLNFGGVSRSQVKVRLRGLGDAWFTVRSHDFRYPALAPGRYTFEATATDPDHQRTSDVARLSFEIVPPWWQRTWFRLAAAAMLIAVLAALWDARRRSARARQRELERRKKEHDALLVRATRDALTGLWNRSTILDILTRELATAKLRGTPLAVAIIDIDHFKRINDTRGHLAGDEVLRTLGAKLGGRVRATDSLGRYGGEEFLLVVPGAPNQRPFLPLERLQRAVAEIPFWYANSKIEVTASFGVAWLDAASDTPELLLSRADEALYSAKHAGRNRVEYAAAG